MLVGETVVPKSVVAIDWSIESENKTSWPSGVSQGFKIQAGPSA